MLPLAAIAVLALLALGATKKSGGTTPGPTPGPIPSGDVAAEAKKLYAANPKLYTAAMAALMNLAVPPWEVYSYAAALGMMGYPALSADFAANFRRRVQHEKGKRREWDVWVNRNPSPTLTAQNIKDGFIEMHVLASKGPDGDFTGQPILVYGQKVGSDKSTRKLGGVWSPMPSNIPATMVSDAKADFGV